MYETLGITLFFVCRNFCVPIEILKHTKYLSPMFWKTYFKNGLIMPPTTNPQIEPTDRKTLIKCHLIKPLRHTDFITTFFFMSANDGTYLDSINLYYSMTAIRFPHPDSYEGKFYSLDFKDYCN